MASRLALDPRSGLEATLVVADLPRSLLFWRDLVGFTVEATAPPPPDPPRLALLRAGLAGLRLVEPALLPRLHGGWAKALDPDRPGTVGLILAVDDVDEAATTMRAVGLAPLEPPENGLDERRAATWRDPDGHLLTLVGPLRDL